MKFVRLVSSFNKNYSYDDASDIEMTILGRFLTSNAYHPESFKEWALADKSDPDSGFNENCGGNTISLEEDHGYIFFVEDISNFLVDLIMSREQFVQLLTDWEEKVINLKPKNVIILRRNNNFIIETNNYNPQAEYVSLILEHNFYERMYESSFKMAIIGFFLSRDVRWDYVNYFKTWTTGWKFGDKQKHTYAINDNIVTLERNKDCTCFTNENPDDDSIESVTYLKISILQFSKLLDDWQKKVCDKKPKMVNIRYEDNELIIEISN